MKPRSALYVAAVVVLAACSTVPITGRRQVNIVSSSEMTALAAQEYGTFLKENPPSKDAAATARVRGVGERIRRAVESYMSGAGLASRLAGYDWQFNLVDNKQVNAWCMPGGRVVVYSGLLPVAKDDTGLAVVMGHEIAHAIAEHGSERMSQQMLAELGGVALDVALAEKPGETRAMWKEAYGVGAQVGALLPFSRLQESEADRLGLIFMAMAGYDPRQAPEFWKRMAAAKEGGAPPQFLSTHPSDATRIAKLEELVPEALKSYRPQG
jgi:predicted Zn-dependent protease